ncbi:hypothetical protein PHSY_004911 [Pseudozyma hubeiensis SY62]|uniref:Uncharacterized protein n=1 Tax=Pseudozyma hubeiensis (strain SY62) TaxID=1305764 RepID=R9P7L3_PSEHS|nr:hypothetical protein PHSY_004911 [Pseudozyma hubeiensis SY62]GAC97326.1 hypothetical protein PHSY_004911 [Pseudozyma hubeiensis SY62]
MRSTSVSPKVCGCRCPGCELSCIDHRSYFDSVTVCPESYALFDRRSTETSSLDSDFLCGAPCNPKTPLLIKRGRKIGSRKADENHDTDVTDKRRGSLKFKITAAVLDSSPTQASSCDSASFDLRCETAKAHVSASHASCCGQAGRRLQKANVQTSVPTTTPRLEIDVDTHRRYRLFDELVDAQAGSPCLCALRNPFSPCHMRGLLRVSDAFPPLCRSK